MWTCGLRFGRKRKEQKPVGTGSNCGDAGSVSGQSVKAPPPEPPTAAPAHTSTQLLPGVFQVLRHIHVAQGCDLLYVSPQLLEPRVSALLRSTTTGCKDPSEEFLDRLMGPEKAQAAVSAILQGTPYKTVLEPELSDGVAASQRRCSNPAPQQVSSGQATPTSLPTQNSIRAEPASNVSPWAGQSTRAQNSQGFPSKENVCLGQQVQQNSGGTGQQQQLAEEQREADATGIAGAGTAGAARLAGVASADNALHLQQLQREPSFMDSGRSLPLSADYAVSGPCIPPAPLPVDAPRVTSVFSAPTQHAGMDKPSASSPVCSTGSGELNRMHEGPVNPASAGVSQRSATFAYPSKSTGDSSRQGGHTLLPTYPSNESPLQSSDSAAAQNCCGSCDIDAGAAEKMHRASSLKTEMQLSGAAMKSVRDQLSRPASGGCERTMVMLEAFTRAASEQLSEGSGDTAVNPSRRAAADPLRRAKSTDQTAKSFNPTCSSPLGAFEASRGSGIGRESKGKQEGLQWQQQQQQQQQQCLTPVCDEAADQWLSTLNEKKALQPVASGDLWQKERTACREQHLPLTTDLHRDTDGGEAFINPSPSNHTPKAFFEVSFHPLTPEPGRQPLAMMSITDVSESQQVQSALMTLTEGQFLLLSGLLPQHAIEFLARHSCTPSAPVDKHGLANSHQQVTLLFMDIVGFTSMAKMVEPQSVMHLLSNLFSTFDDLTDEYKIHKVETAGDCYIVSAGVLSSEAPNGFHSTMETHEHAASARHVMEFAKAVLRESAKVMMPHDGAPVKVRIGIHTGDVMSGVVGSKLPKFSLCGDSMNTASRMESTGKPGRIQVSEATRALLPEYAWEATEIMVKGKGAMRAYMWDHTVNEGWNRALFPRSRTVISPLPEIQHCVSKSGQPQRLPRSTSSTCSRGNHSSSQQSNLLLALRAMEALVSMN